MGVTHDHLWLCKLEASVGRSNAFPNEIAPKLTTLNFFDADGVLLEATTDLS